MVEITKLPWNKKMHHLRIQKGWSQYKAADVCGTNQKNYWNWENGKTYPTKIFRKSIASAFGIPVHELFDPQTDTRRDIVKTVKHSA